MAGLREGLDPDCEGCPRVCPPFGGPESLFARLLEDTDWGLHAASLAVRLSASVDTRRAMLEAANKKQFFRSVVSAMVESTAPEADAAHVKAVLEPALGSTLSPPTWAQAFLDSPVATRRPPRRLRCLRCQIGCRPLGECPVFPPSAAMLRVHLSNARAADDENVVHALKVVFGDSVVVSPEVVSKGFWYLEVCEPAWPQTPPKAGGSRCSPASAMAPSTTSPPRGARRRSLRTRRRRAPSRWVHRLRSSTPPPPYRALAPGEATGPWALGSISVEYIPPPPAAGVAPPPPRSNRYYPLLGWFWLLTSAPLHRLVKMSLLRLPEGLALCAPPIYPRFRHGVVVKPPGAPPLLLLPLHSALCLPQSAIHGARCLVLCRTLHSKLERWYD